MTPSTTLPSTSELQRLATPELIQKSRQIWDVAKVGIPEEHREVFATVLGQMSERLSYAVDGPDNARVDAGSFSA
jgi:hypothetical protein